MNFVTLIDQLGAVDKTLARGYIYRYLCLGYGETHYLEGLLKSKVTSVKNAIRAASKIMIAGASELGRYVHEYLDDFATKVKEENRKWALTKDKLMRQGASSEEIKKEEKKVGIFAYYRKYNEQGELNLIRVKVLDAGFKQGKDDWSFDVLIIGEGAEEATFTVMSRIQKEQHS